MNTLQIVRVYFNFVIRDWEIPIVLKNNFVRAIFTNVYTAEIPDRIIPLQHKNISFGIDERFDSEARFIIEILSDSDIETICKNMMIHNFSIHKINLLHSVIGSRIELIKSNSHLKVVKHG
jgi:hypothetical protein